MIKILILGSNFGSEAYLKALDKISIKKDITISSPNILKKKINYPRLKKNKNYKKLIKKNIYDLIICATTPKIQNQFLDFFFNIHKYKRIKTRLMLEKPLSYNFNNIFKIIEKLKKKKIFFNQNYIFPKIDVWSKFCKFILKKKVSKINYTWKFRQAYFINKKKTWKTDHDKGGGIILYYMSHIIFNLLKIDKRIYFDKIILLEKTNNFITRIKLSLRLQKIKVIIDININSLKTYHKLEAIEVNQKKHMLQNSTKDWTKNFELISEKKIIKKTIDSRVDLTKKNINELIKFNTKKNDYKEFLNTVRKSYKFLQIIEKNIYV